MRTIRYTRQPDNYGCGPTAIINALKWAGVRATLKTHYRPLVIKCKAKDPDGPEFSGTTQKNFQRSLAYASKNRFKVKILEYPTVRKISKELEIGNAVILLHFNKDGTTHYTLVIGKNNEEFTVVNAFHKHKTVANVSANAMIFWTKRKHGLPVAWVLQRHSV